MTCPYCAKDHAGMKCPLVKSLAYQGGEVVRVEFFSPAEMTGPPTTLMQFDRDQGHQFSFPKRLEVT